MEKVLVVSANAKSAEALCDLACRAGASPSPFPCTSGSRARRMVLDESWDLVIINYPLPDDDAEELARMVKKSTDSEVIMTVREEAAAELSSQLAESGIITVVKPVIFQIFMQAVQLAQAFRKKSIELRNENRRLQAKLEEVKLISRAKCILIMKKGCSEEEAHHLIERRAMNSRITLSEAASAIIRIYST